MRPDAARSFRVRAVVLSRADSGEADRLLTVFTRERGLLRVLAKGARKAASRKAGHLEPCTDVDMQLARAQGLPIVTQVETLHAFPALREDLSRLAQAAYVLELVLRFYYENGGAEPAVYEQLVAVLGRIEKEQFAWTAVRFFEMRLLDAVGFRPNLSACARCGREIQAEGQYFSASEGGVVCPKCGSGPGSLAAVSMPALRFLRHLQRSSYADALRARSPDPLRAEVEQLLNSFLTHVLERRLNTPSFLAQLRKK